MVRSFKWKAFFQVWRSLDGIVGLSWDSQKQTFSPTKKHKVSQENQCRHRQFFENLLVSEFKREHDHKEVQMWESQRTRCLFYDHSLFAEEFKERYKVEYHRMFLEDLQFL